MLTKDLIVCRHRAGRLHPQFLRTDDPQMLDFADQLLAVYREGLGSTRGELDALATPLVAGQANLALAKGMRKVLEERCDFTAIGDIDYPAERRVLLLTAAELLRQRPWQSPEEFRAAVRHGRPDSPLADADTLYPDLPDNDRLVKSPDVSPEQLIQRYNVSLVQGLLLQASSLSATVSSPSVAKLRRLLQYLRFFRLLAEVTAESGSLTEPSRPGAAPVLHLRISGPGSVLDNFRRYGVQLASFFPALARVEHWSLTAEVEWKERKLRLELDESSGLVCPYHFFSACLPQEFELFRRHFAEKADGWQFCDDTPMLLLNRGQLIIPDFTFRQNGTGLTVALELFHAWHATELLSRLDWLRRHPEKPLILGIDRSLLKKPELADAVEAMADVCFPFREYPTVERTLKCLSKAAGRMGK